MRALSRVTDAALGPAVVIPAAEHTGLDVTAIGIAVGLGLYGCIGVVLTALALWM